MEEKIIGLEECLQVLQNFSDTEKFGHSDQRSIRTLDSKKKGKDHHRTREKIRDDIYMALWKHQMQKVSLSIEADKDV